MYLTSQTQVEQALQRPLSESELAALEQLALEAEVLLSAYLRTEFNPSSVPLAVEVVCTRMVARALTVSPDAIGVQSQSQQTGPYGQTTTYVPETRSGNAVYLSKTDKEMLSALKPSGIKHLRYGGSR